MSRLQFTVLAICLWSIDASAQAAAESVITTSAWRVWKIAPDHATLHLVIQDSALTAPEAIAKVDARVPVVTRALSRVRPGLVLEPAVMVATGSPLDYPRTTKPTPYVARSVIRVHVDRLASLPDAFSAAYETGATITATYFGASTADSVRQAGLPELIATATKQASTVAAALGGRIGGLIDVTTGEGPGRDQLNEARATGAGPYPPIAPPEVSVGASVRVRYKLAPQPGP